MDTLYRNIKQRREELGLSQDELAKMLGYKSRSSINKIELGLNNLPQSKIVAFANALKTTPSQLMGWDLENDEAEYPLTAKDEKDIAARLSGMIQMLDNQEALMFDGEALDEETKELLKASIENSLRMGKAMAKQKYTPKKYKK